MQEPSHSARERRRFGRMRLNASALLNDRGAERWVELVDLSLGGALVRAGSTPLVAWRSYLLCIPFGRDPEEAIKLHVRVVQKLPGYVRIQWTQLPSPENSHKLRRLMEQELGPIQVVERSVPMVIWPTLSTRERW